jgi:hypothetical protein
MLTKSISCCWGRSRVKANREGCGQNERRIREKGIRGRCEKPKGRRLHAVLPNDHCLRSRMVRKMACVDPCVSGKGRRRETPRWPGPSGAPPRKVLSRAVCGSIPRPESTLPVPARRSGPSQWIENSGRRIGSTSHGTVETPSAPCAASTTQGTGSPNCPGPP